MININARCINDTKWLGRANTDYSIKNGDMLYVTVYQQIDKSVVVYRKVSEFGEFGGYEGYDMVFYTTDELNEFFKNFEIVDFVETYVGVSHDFIGVIIKNNRNYKIKNILDEM